MKNVWIAVAAVALLVSACGGKGFLGGGQASVEQRDLFEKQQAAQQEAQATEQKAKEEQIRKEQEDLRKQLAAQQAQGRQEGQGPSGQEGQGAAGEQPLVTPLPPTTLTEQALKDSAAAMGDPGNPLSKRSVYFGYDSYSLDPEFSQVVEAHAKFLLDHPQVRLRLEGHCDIRGSREYNLALGQRRSDAVKRAFTLLGVPTGQIESVSFGKEKPRMQGDTEEAHHENRRVDIVYSGKEAMTQ
jgi:peptidoglycan-associated lipoprotein